MKKTSLFLLFLITTIRVACAQINWGSYSQSFADGTTDNASAVGIMLAIPEANNSFWRTDEDGRYPSALSKDPAFMQLRPQSTFTRVTFDTARAQFFLHGVNKINAGGYQYRVTVYPSKVLVPWTGVNQFTNAAVIKSSGLPQMAYLGGYKAAFGNTLVVDVRKAGSDRIISSAAVAWKAINPVVTNIYTSDNFDAFLKALQYPWASRTATKAAAQGKGLTLPSSNKNLIFLLKDNIYHKNQVQYEVIKNGAVFIPWKINDYDNSFVWLKDLPAGLYRLKIRYTVQPQHVSEYPFEIVPQWYQSNWFKIVAGIFICAFFGAFLSLALFIRQKQINREVLANKTKLQLELKAIYAQLNPHFIFNALSSIQGLINKQDIKGANSYLSDFARLMRESLNNSNKEQVSLHQEIQALDTYLKLEQLRFGFKYHVAVDKAINSYDNSIPTLLLQPLIENAVKHGVASLGTEGLISLSFTRAEASMLVFITDNGKGFDVDLSAGGFGLKLTRDRLKLLNELSKTQQIMLEINGRSAPGTQITITFNHWFL